MSAEISFQTIKLPKTKASQKNCHGFKPVAILTTHFVQKTEFAMPLKPYTFIQCLRK